MFALVFAAFLLCFFTCFFAVGAGVLFVSAGLASCAAKVRPAVARARERPRTAEVIFFMVFVRFLFKFEPVSLTASDLIDEANN